MQGQDFPSVHFRSVPTAVYGNLLDLQAVPNPAAERPSQKQRGFSHAMCTRRSTAAASSSTRKRRSASTTPAESPAKRRTTRGAGASAAATVADPPTLVPVAPPGGSGWCLALRPAREAGQFIDITLLVGGRKIAAHKVALVGFSPYLLGLLTSGLAEVKAGGDTLKVGDEHTDAARSRPSWTASTRASSRSRAA
jgi:hypothetical protein